MKVSPSTIMIRIKISRPFVDSADTRDVPLVKRAKPEEATGSEEEETTELLFGTLYQFHGPKSKSPPRIEVVFFHGLQYGESRNEYFKTWTSSDGSTIWAKTWLAEKFPEARILSVSYDCSAIKGQRKGTLDLYLTAENLIQDLINDGQLAARTACPIVLVGKDMGCMVIKAVCVMAKERGFTTFVRNVKGSFFYCPLQLGVQNLHRKFNSELAQMLVWGNKEISRLNSAFSKLKQQEGWNVSVMQAAYKSTSDGVDESLEESARVDADDVYTALEDGDTICRPPSRKAATFTYLTQFISRFYGFQSQGRTGSEVKFRLPFEDDPYYVPVEKTIREVRASLITHSIVLLHGVAGSGKSSLAKYLSLRFHEESLASGPSEASTSDAAASCFPDGIIFLMCGHGAEVISKQRELLRLLDAHKYEELHEVQAGMGDTFERASSPLQDEVDEKDLRQALHEKLQKYLSELRALVVLDDVWGRDILDGLLIRSGNVRYLLTAWDPLLSLGSRAKNVQMEDLNADYARQILAKYAGLDGGAIPEHLQNEADDLIQKTESHPLSLATLGTILSIRKENAILVNEWRRLKDDLIRRLGPDDSKIYGQPVLYGRRYPYSVLECMILAVDELDEDVKKLLYIIVLFRGDVAEKLLELFLQCMKWNSTLTAIHVPTRVRDLWYRGLLQQVWLLPMSACMDFEDVDWKSWFKSEGDYWKAWSIHSLRRHAILTAKKAEISEITNFLTEDFQIPTAIPKSLCLAECVSLLLFSANSSSIRSDCDLATALFALYGEKGCKEKAAERIDQLRFRRSRFDITEAGLASSLRSLLPILLRERQAFSGVLNYSKVVQKVFWKVITNRELDCANITRLLNVPVYASLTCSFLADFTEMSWRMKQNISVKAMEAALTRLLCLLSDHEHTTEAIKRPAISAIVHISKSFESRLALRQIPGCVETLMALMTESVREDIQVRALGAFFTLVFASPDDRFIVKYPGCLERLLRLLGKEKKQTTRALAAMVFRLALISGGETLASRLKEVMALTPEIFDALFAMVTECQAKDVQTSAISAIATLSKASTNFRLQLLTPAQNELFREECAGLLARDAEEDVQLCGTTAFADLTENFTSEEAVGKVSAYFETLVGLLQEDERQSDSVLQYHPTATATDVVYQGQIDALSIDGFKDYYRYTPAGYKKAEKMEDWEGKPQPQHGRIHIQSTVRYDENLMAILKTRNFLERVVGFLGQHEKPNIQILALRIIRNLASCTATVKPITSYILGHSETLTKLVDLVAANVQPSIQGMAALVISKLADQKLFHSRYVREKIGDVPSCLQRLVGLVGADLPQRVQWAALRAVGNLACSPANNMMLARIPGFLERLTDVLTEQPMQEIAMEALLRLTEVHENREAIAKCPGCLEGIVGCFGENADARCRELAVVVFGNLAGLATYQVSIASIPSCLPLLVNLVADGTQPSTQWHAVVALHNLSWEPDNKTTMATFPGLWEMVDGLLQNNVKSYVPFVRTVLINFRGVARSLLTSLLEVGYGDS